MSDDTVVELKRRAEIRPRDLRRHPRWKVFEIAALTGIDGTAACVIDNLSASGALVSADLALSPEDAVTFELDEFGTIPARVVHTRNSLVGLEFDFDEAARARFQVWLDEVEKEGPA